MGLNFCCRFCPEKSPNFKTLVEHYWQHHSKKTKHFLIRHKPTGHKVQIHAPSEFEALQFAGWEKKDCKIEVIE